MKVLYHANCNDGFCAAFVIKWNYPDLKDSDFVPVQYGCDFPPIENIENEDILVLDFSYKKDIMEDVLKKSKSLLVIDHHKTAQEDLKELQEKYPDNFIFDMGKSGAKLTYEKFYYEPNKPVTDIDTWLYFSRWLVDYVEDRDLWLWKMPESREVNIAISCYPRDFEVWKYFNLENLKIEGRSLLRYQNQIVESQSKFAKEIKFLDTIEGYDILCINCTCFISEICGVIAKGRPFGLSWFQREDGKFSYSLRSDENGLDVSVIAKKFGGGGHARASGFELNYLIPELLVTKLE